MTYNNLTFFIIGGAAILLLALFSMGMALYNRKRGKETPLVIPDDDCATCESSIETCERICSLEAAVKPIEYFDDEELDVYKERTADSYTEKEVAQFSEVLYTMQPSEVQAWSRSLTLRGIELPNQLKDEVIALIND